MSNFYPVTRVELPSGTLLLRGGEPISARTPCPIWEPLLRREIAERLGLRVNFRPYATWRDGAPAQTSFRWSGESGTWRAEVESWWRIAPEAEVRP